MKISQKFFRLPKGRPPPRVPGPLLLIDFPVRFCPLLRITSSQVHLLSPAFPQVPRSKNFPQIFRCLQKSPGWKKFPDFFRAFQGSGPYRGCSRLTVKEWAFLSSAGRCHSPRSNSNRVSPPGLQSTRVNHKACSRGRACRYTPAPPATATRPCRAVGRWVCHSASGDSGSLWLSTRMLRPGSGPGKDCQVLRPITKMRPSVTRLK